MFSEERRQIVHIAMGGFALLLRMLTWWQAAVMAAAACAFNALLLPRLGGQALYRPSDIARGFPIGILLYPIVVLGLILVFRTRLDLAAAAWGILAAGDGAATLVGRNVRSPRIPWNHEKTVAGTIAFILCGGVAAVFLEIWTAAAMNPMPRWPFLIGAPLAAVVVAALVETSPIRLDDNVTVAGAAALVLWALSLIREDAVRAALPLVQDRLVGALIINGVFAAAGWRFRTVSTAGALTGAALGIAIYLAAGPGAWLLLFASFLMAVLSSRLGWQRKSLLGIAEDRGGKRGPGNAIANCVVGAGCAVLAALTPHGELALVGMVAALAAGGSDTVASEIGKAWGHRTFSVTTFATVRPGTSGAMSLEGTAAGLAAAIALAGFALVVGLIQPALVWPVVAAATVGSFVESLLGATLEGAGILDNHTLNFLNTLVASAAAVALGLVAGLRA
jgi:uncharacterized protein (TIGR00297 family)